MPRGIRQITRQITSNRVEPWGPNQGTHGSACPIWRGFLRSSLLSLWKCQPGIIRCDFSTDARNVEFHMQSLILNVATNSFFFFFFLNKHIMRQIYNKLHSVHGCWLVLREEGTWDPALIFPQKPAQSPEASLVSSKPKAKNWGRREG